MASSCVSGSAAVSVVVLLPLKASPILTFVGGWLVNWCFEPSQPVGIISGLKETFTKRHIVETTNKAEK